MKINLSCISLVVGSCGLSVSSYLMYMDAKKQNWTKVKGYIDNATLKYTSNFLLGTYYIGVDYYFDINEKRINGSKKYKICVNILKNKPTETDNKRIYAQKLFEQVGRTKHIYVAYDPENWENTDPLIYIYDNEMLWKNKFFDKWKNSIRGIKEVLQFWKNSDRKKEIENVISEKNESNEKNEPNEKNVPNEKNEPNEKNVPNKKNVPNEKNVPNKKNVPNEKNVTSDRNDSPEQDYSNSEIAEPNKKKLINSYDINNMFPIYMFSCSCFLILSFLFKRRIYYVRKEISLQKTAKNKML